MGMGAVGAGLRWCACCGVLYAVASGCGMASVGCDGREDNRRGSENGKQSE